MRATLLRQRTLAAVRLPKNIMSDTHFSERSEYAPPIRGTRTPKPNYSVASGPRRSTSWVTTHGRGRPWFLGRSGAFLSESRAGRGYAAVHRPWTVENAVGLIADPVADRLESFLTSGTRYLGD